jgi:hypothetical protein
VADENGGDERQRASTFDRLYRNHLKNHSWYKRYGRQLSAFRRVLVQLIAIEERAPGSLLTELDELLRNEYRDELRRRHQEYQEYQQRWHQEYQEYQEYWERHGDRD